jgi:uncharacterized membrane protein YgcG
MIAGSVPLGILRTMHRCLRALSAALVLVAIGASGAGAAGPPFPDPVVDQAVYDTAGILTPETEQELETIIDAAEGRSGAEIVVYTQLAPGIGEEQNFDNARALIDQWGIGRSGFDDGLVLMIGMQANLVNGRVALFGGSGFIDGYASEGDLESIVEGTFVPRAIAGDLDGATLATIREVDARITPGGRDRIETKRTINAAIGLIGAPIAFVAVLGLAWNKWRREGDDPELTDSPSILMAGPPAEMTPALATVIRNGRADQHTINTVLAELASNGRIEFRNLDRVRGMKSDDDPDPLTDPAIEVKEGSFDDDRLGPPQLEAWDKIQRLAGGDGVLSRERLWRVNSTLDPVKGALEFQAVKVGWLARMPGPSIGRMVAAGSGVVVVGIGIGILGFVIPMSGALLLGAALVLGGIATIGFGLAMSQRTPAGAYVDAMLTAYRRTLRKTMEQARTMGEVVEQPEINKLADTPDKAVVWGMALGLHDEVAALLARGLEEQRKETGSPAGAYYPVWLGSSPSSAWSGANVAGGGPILGSGSGFSDSAIPDIGGMFNALGSVGSSPPSSSSSGGGGGFGGGGGGGGGGGSGSF